MEGDNRKRMQKEIKIRAHIFLSHLFFSLSAYFSMVQQTELVAHVTKDMENERNEAVRNKEQERRENKMKIPTKRKRGRRRDFSKGNRENKRVLSLSFSSFHLTRR